MPEVSGGARSVRTAPPPTPARDSARRALVALLLGALHAASFAPLDGWWLQPLALAGLIVLLEQAEPGPRWRADFLVTLCFGVGSFVAGIGWMYVSMHRYGGMPAPMAAAAVVLLSVYLATFAALAVACVRRLGAAPGALAALGAALLFAGGWTLGELARGYLMTGFPWLAIGYAHMDGPLRHLAPLLGVYGVGLCAALTSFGLARTWLMARQRRIPLLGLVLVALPATLGLALASVQWAQPGAQPVSVRLLQGNVPQELKFDPQRALQAMSTYVEMVEAGHAELTVLPETAWTSPWRYTPLQIGDRLARHAARGGALVMGMPLDAAQVGTPEAPGAARPAITNSVAVIGPEGEITNRYDKRHLVPFGEFVPATFGWFVRMMDIPLGEFARGAAGQPALVLGDERVAFNICFEDLFGEELAEQVRDGASILVNLSNLAWFGDSHALDQHLRIARMRSLELARPMLRATNTGVTAAIDHTGTVIARLPTGERATLATQVHGASGLTPYARLGNLPALALALVLAATGAGLCARARRRTR